MIAFSPPNSTESAVRLAYNEKTEKRSDHREERLKMTEYGEEGCTAAECGVLRIPGREG
jgi:hypothetical protein